MAKVGKVESYYYRIEAALMACCGYSDSSCIR